MKKASLFAVCLAALVPCALHAQSPCKGAPLSGTVIDPTGAIIPGAVISVDGRATRTSDSAAHFYFPCERLGKHHLQISAPSFAPRDLTLTLPLNHTFNAVLHPAAVQTTVTVNGNGSGAMNATSGGGASETISGDQLQTLADDPDDLLKQLQQLAGANGGNPLNTTISVDGFQDSTTLPPKNSIAYIQVNPDMFSAEYREPPFEGGRVNIYTKPGLPTFHGDLFAVNGSPWMNARDPFSPARGALGEQRYGFDLNGPISRKTSDFSMSLEHRSIDDEAVVNAITLDASGNQQTTLEDVPDPQRLWIGTVRTDWQLGPKNTFTASYSANVNHLHNVGVGGVSLASTAYDSLQYTHTIRLLNITTASAKLMHETHLSFKWVGEDDTPVSTAPQLNVAGAFTGGGATIGPQQLHDFGIEADDDAVINTKHHLLKIGTQFFLDHVNDQMTTNFNGTYTFGGGTAPVLDANNNPTGATETITGLEQYRRALLNLPGGAPTAFSNVAGTPHLSFTQVQDALYVQDDWTIRPRLHAAFGMRYWIQNDPAMYNAATPRAGILWSPDKKATWKLAAHVGLFAGAWMPTDYAQFLQEDGTQRITSTVYSPSCADVNTASSTCDPFTGATTIHSLRTLDPHLDNISFGIEEIEINKTLPHGWNLSSTFGQARIWNDQRSENINSPLNDSPTGPRPGPADTNILQVQNSAQGGANVEFLGLEQHTLKHIQLFVGAVRVNVFDDCNDSPFFTPQSVHTDAGEFARRSGNSLWHVFGNALIHLPEKIDLSGNFHANGDAPYDIETGFDNNGDGDFNDRPQYATPGQAGAIQTPYGLLVASGGTGTIPRDIGHMPWQIYLDTNIERTFHLTKNAKANHPQTLLVNIRSSNVLNHENVTAVGGILGSPLFGVPYAADNGRRVEAGLRYTF